MTEIWKQIKDFPNYEVSNFGRIRTWNSRESLRKIPKVLKEVLENYRYLVVGLCKNKNRINKYIHRLVLGAFIGPCLEGKEVNHKDGNKQNNHIDNLEYVTKSENIRHADRFGLRKMPSREKHWSSKLTEEQVKEIRRLYALRKYSQKEIGKVFNISQTIVCRIVHNFHWKI